MDKPVRFQHFKRQVVEVTSVRRVPVSEITIPVDTTTTARGRVRTTATTRVSADDAESTSARRGNNTAVVSSTTLPSTTAIPVADTSSRPVAVVSTPTSLLPSSSAAGTANADGANTSSTSSGTNGALIGGVIAAVAAVALIAGLIFYFVRKRKAQNVDGGFGFGGKKEKEDDERSFIGASADMGDRSTEKSQQYGMSEISHSSSSGPHNQWHNASSDLGYNPPPSSVARSSQEVLASQPSYPVGGFIPPQAAMMNAPATRLSVANPYVAAQQQAPGAPAGAAGMPAIQEDSPFEDPQWATKLFKVTRSFQPSMPDELIIMPGDRIRVLMAYDDGWCLGENLDSVPANSPHQPIRGVFPRDCVEEIGLQQLPVTSTEPSSPTSATRPQSGAPVAAPAIVAPEQDRAASPTKGSDLQRAPTLPSMDFGRASQTFADAPYDPSKRASLAQPQQNATESKPSHLSTSSSLNHDSSMIDDFPDIPTSSTPTLNRPGAGSPVKRTSSLIAGKDSELFAALALSDSDANNLR